MANHADHDGTGDEGGEGEDSREEPGELVEFVIEGLGVARNEEGEGGREGRGGVVFVLGFGDKLQGDETDGVVAGRAGEAKGFVAEGLARQGGQGRGVEGFGVGQGRAVGVAQNEAIAGLGWAELVGFDIELDAVVSGLDEGHEGMGLGGESLVEFGQQGEADEAVEQQRGKRVDDERGEGGAQDQAGAKGADHGSPSSTPKT